MQVETITEITWNMIQCWLLVCGFKHTAFGMESTRERHQRARMEGNLVKAVFDQ